MALCGRNMLPTCRPRPIRSRPSRGDSTPLVLQWNACIMKETLETSELNASRKLFGNKNGGLSSSISHPIIEACLMPKNMVKRRPVHTQTPCPKLVASIYLTGLMKERLTSVRRYHRLMYPYNTDMRRGGARTDNTSDRNLGRTLLLYVCSIPSHGLMLSFSPDVQLLVKEIIRPRTLGMR